MSSAAASPSGKPDVSNTSITPTQIAWVAGIFEGEGTLVLTPQGQWQLVVKMTDEDIVRRLRLHTGVGLIGALKPQQAHWKPQWRWSVTNVRDVDAVLSLIRPYLGKRRGARADEFLTWLAAGKPQVSTAESRERDRRRMQRKRGWAGPSWT